MSTEARILEPGQMEAPLGAIRFLFLPEQDGFAKRAERFRSLSRGHALSSYLAFLAALSDAQQEALSSFSGLPFPGSAGSAHCRRQGLPPLDARSLQRDPAWRKALVMILRHMIKTDLPSAASETAAALMQATEAYLEKEADKILSGEQVALSPREQPFIAAALQVYWVRMASALKEDAPGRLEQEGLCPVCGSRPNVGIVLSSGAEQGLRYLSCSLCGSQWHMVRIKCSSCESTEGIDYHILEGSKGAVKAESCSSCGSYRKLLYLNKDSRMDATADDLATLALDMLMDQEGTMRRGPNLLFHPGRQD